MHSKEGPENPEFTKMMAAVEKVQRRCQVSEDTFYLFLAVQTQSEDSSMYDNVTDLLTESQGGRS